MQALRFQFPPPVSGGSVLLHTNANKMAESIAHKVHLQFLTIKDIARSSPAHRPHIARTSPTHRPLRNTASPATLDREKGMVEISLPLLGSGNAGDAIFLSGRCAGDVWAMSGR